MGSKSLWSHNWIFKLLFFTNGYVKIEKKYRVDKHWSSISWYWKYELMWVYNSFDPHCTVLVVHTSSIMYGVLSSTRLSKIFETFNIQSDLNFSNTQNSRSEHIWNSICFELRILRISRIYSTPWLGLILSGIGLNWLCWLAGRS